MFVSGHCGGASPKDFPLKWNVHLDIGPSNFSPQQGAPLLTVADFQRASEALAALASERGMSGEIDHAEKLAIEKLRHKKKFGGTTTCTISTLDDCKLLDALSRQQPAGAPECVFSKCPTPKDCTGPNCGNLRPPYTEQPAGEAGASTPQPANRNAMRDDQ
jgi:hypothetical protein